MLWLSNLGMMMVMFDNMVVLPSMVRHRTGVSCTRCRESLDLVGHSSRSARIGLSTLLRHWRTLVVGILLLQHRWCRHLVRHLPPHSDLVLHKYSHRLVCLWGRLLLLLVVHIGLDP